MSYRVNQPDITHETFDREVVIINLQRGLYYSLDQVGADIWQLILQGHHRDEIAIHIARCCCGDHKEMEQAIDSFLRELEEEGIISIVDPEGHMPLTPCEQRATRPFVAPVLGKYSDLQDLLLLDPIHEVSDKGWPVNVEK